MSAIPLKFQIGARTIASIDRALTRVAYHIDDVVAATPPDLPPLIGDGYLVTSLPESLLPIVVRSSAGDGLIAAVRQRYVRYHTDLSEGEAAWLAGMSANARATIRRKAKRLAATSGGKLDIRAYRTP